jgi:phage tail-like protein
MARANVTNYVTGNRFYVGVDNIISASFYQMTGLGFTLKKTPYAEGGLISQQRYYLDPVQFKDIKLKRGITNDKDFLQWAFELLGPGATYRRTVNIFAYNQAGESMQQWILSGARVIGWEGPTLKADANVVAFEELTIAYQALSFAGLSYSAGLSLGASFGASMGISAGASLSMGGFGMSASASASGSFAI